MNYLISKIAGILITIIFVSVIGFVMFVVLDQVIDTMTNGQFDLMDIRCDMFGITEMCAR